MNMTTTYEGYQSVRTSENTENQCLQEDSSAEVDISLLPDPKNNVAEVVDVSQFSEPLAHSSRDETPKKVNVSLKKKRKPPTSENVADSLKKQSELKMEAILQEGEYKRQEHLAKMRILKLKEDYWKDVCNAKQNYNIQSVNQNLNI